MTLQSKVTEKVTEAQKKAEAAAEKNKPSSDAILAQAQQASVSNVQFTSAESVGSFSGKAAAAAGVVTVQEAQSQKLDDIVSATAKTAEILQRQEDRDQE